MSRRAKGSSAYPATIQVANESKERFVRWLEQNRSPHMGQTVGAIIDWFVGQRKPVQDVVLGEVSDEMRPAYAAALRVIADQIEQEDKPPAPIDDVTVSIPETQKFPKRKRA